MVNLKTTQNIPLPQLSAFWPLCLASLLTHLLAGMLWGFHLLREAKATPTHCHFQPDPWCLSCSIHLSLSDVTFLVYLLPVYCLSLSLTS